MKRLMDISFSLLGLLILSPVLFIFMFLIYRQDGHSPFYIATRMGKGEVPFKMVKLRSMVMEADKTGVDSTSANDVRITKVGHLIRRYKLDELMQLWNVLRGDMSLVGPRPNVKRDTDLYTAEEKQLLSIKPGITDFSSIVFSDEGDILADKHDPDIAYHQLIRPGKSKLGLFYIENRNIFLDIRLIILTVNAIISRASALSNVTAILTKLHAPEDLIRLSSRQQQLIPTPPPGADKIVTSRDDCI